MILYHPAKDINHCIYRMVAILLHSEVTLTLDKLRLLDFYYAFPHLIKEIKPWPSEISNFKKVIDCIPDPYEKIPNKRRLLYEMKEIQKSSIAILHAKGLIGDSLYREGEIVIDHEIVPEKLIEEIGKDEFISSDIFNVLIQGLLKVRWEGGRGLKCRTGLLEYKYDE